MAAAHESAQLQLLQVCLQFIALCQISFSRLHFLTFVFVLHVIRCYAEELWRMRRTRILPFNSSAISMRRFTATTEFIAVYFELETEQISCLRNRCHGKKFTFTSRNAVVVFQKIFGLTVVSSDRM